MGACLLLAVLLGYMLADPLDLSSLVLVVFVLGALSIPLFMKWYYPLLVASWNAAITPVILPGRPELWMVLSLAGVVVAFLSRAVNSKAKFLFVPSVNYSLGLLVAVVVLTGLFTGGFGLAMLGSDRHGGKKYFLLLCAIAGYFVLTSRRIPLRQARLYTALFFLSGLTALVGNVVYKLGPSAYFLFNVFNPDFALDQAAAEVTPYRDIVRITGFSWAAPALSSYLLARYGIQGIAQRPFRLLLLAGAIFLSLFGGFRSTLIMFLLTFAVLFYLEGLHRTKYVLILLAAGLVTVVGLIPFASRLPLVAQRTLSFLPFHLDPVATQSASVSSEWRIEVWRTVLPEVPKHLFKGKGYSLDPNELFMAEESVARHYVNSGSGAAFTGDYHNGPLSVLIPFGIYGAVAFCWFLFAGIRTLSRNYKHGHPELRTINGLLLAAFTARTIFFFFVFGSISSDMAIFAGLLGLGVALNGGDASQPATETQETAERVPAFSRPYIGTGLIDHV